MVQIRIWILDGKNRGYKKINDFPYYLWISPNDE